LSSFGPAPFVDDVCSVIVKEIKTHQRAQEAMPSELVVVVAAVVVIVVSGVGVVSKDSNAVTSSCYLAL